MGWLKIGHRGAAGTRPELTIPSFERAIELGVDMIELDVQLTCDQGLVVLHDRELGRTVRAAGPVREHSLAELCDLDAGAWFGPAYAGARVPSLQEVLDLTRGRVELNVEIKSPTADWEKTAEALVCLLERTGRLPATIISSFQVGALRAVREASPSARIGLLWQTADLETAWSEAAALGARSAHLLWGLGDAAAVSAAHARGLDVIVWTANSPDAIGRLVACGADGVISDYPELFGSL
jgi:glycerophosphoryl diester phosphodiesterase